MPGWILPLFGGVLAIILLGGIMMLSQGNDNETSSDDDLATAPSEPATDPDLAGEVAPPEIPTETTPPTVGSSSSLTNSIGMQLVEVISDGSRMMGTNEPTEEAFRDEKPSHSVNLPRRFQVGMHEVTQAQFAEIMGENPSTFTGDKLPVNNVSWHQAVDFCEKLSLRKEEFDAKRAYRLPTEAEWEYMARWGTKTIYHFGDDPASLDAHAWYNANSNKATQPVGQKNPNPLGLHDMLGNVSEWCSDWYSSDYYIVSSTEIPLGPREGQVKVLRGGSWAGGTRSCRDRCRFFCVPGLSTPATGFRVICIPSTGTQLLSSGQPLAEPANMTGSPEDLARTLIEIFKQGEAKWFPYHVPTESDLVQLDPAIFSGHEDRTVAIKEALVHYSRIPSNLSFVMGISRNEAASRYDIGWPTAEIDDIEVKLLTGTTGMEHFHAMKIIFSTAQNNNLRYTLYLNGAANFRGRWKITNRISHDALRPIYPEPLPSALLLATGSGYPTAPHQSFTDDGLGVRTYDPVGAIQLPHPPGHILSKGLAFNHDATLVAYAYDLDPNPNRTGFIVADGRITVWKSATGEVVLDDKWVHEEITATRRDLVRPDFNNLQMKVAFSLDNSRLAIGRDRVISWDLDSRNKLPVQDPDGFRWRLDAKGNALPDDPIDPLENALVTSESGKFQLAATRKVDQQGKISTEIQLRQAGGEVLRSVVLPGEIPRLLFTAEDQPLAVSKQFIFDIAADHILAEKHPWSNERHFQDMMVNDICTNQQRVIMRYGRTFNRWLARIWDVPSGREIFVPNEDLHRFDFGLTTRHSLSPNGRWLAIADRDKIKFWLIFDPLLE